MVWVACLSLFLFQLKLDYWDSYCLLCEKDLYRYRSSRCYSATLLLIVRVPQLSTLERQAVPGKHSILRDNVIRWLFGKNHHHSSFSPHFPELHSREFNRWEGRLFIGELAVYGEEDADASMTHAAVLLRSCGQQQAAGHMQRADGVLVTLRRRLDASRRASWLEVGSFLLNVKSWYSMLSSSINWRSFSYKAWVNRHCCVSSYLLD
jgi:hypothetical protein